jgi:hypothetical protein
VRIEGLSIDNTTNACGMTQEVLEFIRRTWSTDAEARPGDLRFVK